MDIELKFIIFWSVLTGILYILTRIHFAVAKGNYTWKFFVEEYSNVGIAYKVSLHLGIVVISAYVLIRLIIWWFSA